MHSGKSRALRLKLYVGKKKTAVWKTTISFQEKGVRIEDHTPGLNKKVLGFASARQGEKVGDGECWTLAARALEKAGARRDGIYRFGRELGPRDVIFPGDVIQFEKVKIGSATMPHHTAVVYEVLGSDKLEIIHQNFGSAGKTVSRLTIDLATHRSGTIQFFRPRT